MKQIDFEILMTFIIVVAMIALAFRAGQLMGVTP